MTRSITRRHVDAGETDSRSRRRRTTAQGEETEDRGGRTPRRTAKTRGSASRRGGRGWGAVAQAEKARSSFPDRLKVDKGKKGLIKFLENEPFDTYYVHWIKELPQGTKKSWTCIASDNEGTGCPLCTELDDQPAYRALFNVVDMTGKEPALAIWEATPDPLDRIGEARNDYGDLSEPDLYFVVSKSKQKNGFYGYKVERVKARDLDEDWGIDPLSEDELELFSSKLYTDESTESPSVEDLEEVIELLEE